MMQVYDLKTLFYYYLLVLSKYKIFDIVLLDSVTF